MNCDDVVACKYCPDCGEHKPLADFWFYKKKGTPRKYCKKHWMEREVAAARKRRIDDPDLAREKRWKHSLWTLYRIRADDYWRLWAQQGGVCAICKQPNLNASGGEEKLCVDHDHESGEVRGLLCATDNLAIGQLKDSPERCYSAGAYLEEWRKKKCPPAPSPKLIPAEPPSPERPIGLWDCGAGQAL